MSDKLAYTLPEAVEVTPYSEATLRRAIRATSAVDKNGQPIFPPPLRAKKGGKGFTILRRDLEAWLESLPDA